MNAAILAEGLGISGQTVARCHDLLVDLMLMRRRMPWFENTGKRVVKSPKVYVCDIGLTHALLNPKTTEAPLGHSVVGGSWEGFCLENLIAVAPLGGEAFFYRSAGGAESDLVLRLASGAVWAIEIKRRIPPKISRGF